MMPRYAGMAEVAASTARAVGEAIDVDQVDILKRKAGRANFAAAADYAAQDAIQKRVSKAR